MLSALAFLVAATQGSVDETVRRFMAENQVPGCAVALLDNGKLVFAKGYGERLQEPKEPFTTDTICGIASVTKSVTGLAVLRLIQSGKISMDSLAIETLLKAGLLKRDAIRDERTLRLTVADLLRHESGLGDRHVFWPTRSTMRELGLKTPPELPALVARGLKEPLYEDPGTKFRYTNVNFWLLDLLVHSVVGKPYETAAKELVLTPAGITGAKLFSSRLADRSSNEARQYDLGSAPEPSCLPGEEGRMVPTSYGGIDYGRVHLWCMSVSDLAKLVVALPTMEGRGGILDETGRRLLFSRPRHDLGLDAAGNPANWYYSGGVWVNWTGVIGRSKVFFAHSGNASGSFAGFKGDWKGRTVVVVGNGNDSRYDMADRLIDELRKLLA